MEGIEHHLSWDSIDRIGDLVQFFEENPDYTKELKIIQQKNDSLE